MPNDGLSHTFGEAVVTNSHRWRAARVGADVSSVRVGGRKVSKLFGLVHGALDLRSDCLAVNLGSFGAGP